MKNIQKKDKSKKESEIDRLFGLVCPYCNKRHFIPSVTGEKTGGKW